MWLCNSIKSSSWHAFNRPCKSFLGKNRHVTTINDIRDIWHLRIKKTDNTYTSLHAPHNQPSGRKFKVKEKKNIFLSLTWPGVTKKYLSRWEGRQYAWEACWLLFSVLAVEQIHLDTSVSNEPMPCKWTYKSITRWNTNIKKLQWSQYEK